MTRSLLISIVNVAAITLVSCTAPETSRDGAPLSNTQVKASSYPSPTDESQNEQPKMQAMQSDASLVVSTSTVVGHLATMKGTLEIQKDCYVINDGKTAYIAIWPQGTKTNPADKSVELSLDVGGYRSYLIGAEYVFVGGVVSSVDGGSAAYRPKNASCKGKGWAISASQNWED